MLLLVELVGAGGKGARDAVGDGVLAGDVALGLLLVALLGGGGGSALDGLGDVVGGVLVKVLALLLCMVGMGSGTHGDGVGDLTDDALVGSVGVGGRHVNGLGWWVVGFELVFELIDESVCVEGRENKERRR